MPPRFRGAKHRGDEIVERFTPVTLDLLAQVVEELSDGPEKHGPRLGAFMSVGNVGDDLVRPAAEVEMARFRDAEQVGDDHGRDHGEVGHDLKAGGALSQRGQQFVDHLRDARFPLGHGAAGEL
jgi:hypothetical protein